MISWVFEYQSLYPFEPLGHRQNDINKQLACKVLFPPLHFVREGLPWLPFPMFFPNPFGLEMQFCAAEHSDYIRECFVFLKLQQHVPAESCLFRPIRIFLDTSLVSLRSKCVHCFPIITMSSPTQWDVVANSLGTGTEHQPTLISADCDKR